MFHANLRYIRKERGITQETLADRMNVSVDTVRRWESGKRKPYYEDILNLSEILKVSTDVFFGNKTPTNIKCPEDLSNLINLLRSDQLSSIDIIILVAMLTKMAIEQTQVLSSRDYDILRILLDRTYEALREKKSSRQIPINKGNSRRYMRALERLYCEVIS